MNQPAMNMTDDTPNFEAIKTKQQATWGSGDYGRIGVTLQLTGESLAEAMDLRAGQSVLDVAAGNGNVTLAAARRFCKVVSTDYVDDLLKQSEARAQAEGFSVDYRVADAEALPFDDNQFDNVVSTFGVMFAPDQPQSASELARVCRPGGKIGMANWTPNGFIGQLFKTIGKFVPPPAGVKSPALWGTHDFIHQNFADAADVSITEKQFVFRYQSADHWLDLFRTFYGPVHKAFGALDNEKAEQLDADIRNVIDNLNVASDGTMVVPSDYLEIVVTK